MRNKLVKVGKLIGNPTDVFYQINVNTYAMLEGSGQTEGQECWTWQWVTLGGCTRGRGLSTRDGASTSIELSFYLSL
jgi:hypothetical protein